MNETIKDLVEKLIGYVEGGNSFVNNELALIRLDAESADKHIQDLEDKVEELEWASDDYFTIDKELFDTEIYKVISATFIDNPTYSHWEPEDAESVVNEICDDIKAVMEAKSKKDV